MQRICCTVDGCDRPYQTRGWCDMHYRRWKAHGDPLWTPPGAVERFWSHVDRNGPIHPTLETRCWLWTGHKNDRGYGRFQLDGKCGLAHRFALAQTMGMFAPWLNQLESDHKCHNHGCVRPDHLRPTTKKQNQEHRRGARRESESGVRGVVRRGNRWEARAISNRKYIYGGLFDTIAEAEQMAIALRNRNFTHNDLDR